MKNFEELIRRLREIARRKGYGIEAEAADALERMQWIPVSERLPKPYQTVTVGFAGCPVSPVQAFWTGYEWSIDVMKEAIQVTHWMPLPQQPPAALDHDQPARTDIGTGDAKV